MLIYKIVWALHFIIALLLIIVVLLQTGKGSEVGFAFGSGAAQTMFGSGGGKTFITRFTVILAVLFMLTSIFLSVYQTRKIGPYKGVLNKVKKAEQPQIPAEKKPQNSQQKP